MPHRLTINKNNEVNGYSSRVEMSRLSFIINSSEEAVCALQ